MEEIEVCEEFLSKALRMYADKVKRFIRRQRQYEADARRDEYWFEFGTD